MKTSDSISELVKALAAAQGEFPPIEKNRTGKVQTEKASFSYDYADLSDVLSAVRPALSKYGLAISHDAVVTRDPVLSVSVTARLEHESGQWKESSPLEIPCDGRMGAAQLIGSADTYGRRYTTCSILGVVAESDDDGTGAAGLNAETTQKRREPSPACPKCGSENTMPSQFGEPGTLYCNKKRGGCGNQWIPQTVKELAEQTGMTTADKLSDQNPTTEELDQATEYSERFASVWSKESLTAMSDELRNKKEAGQITPWVRSKALESYELAKSRVEIASKVNWRNEEIKNMLRDLEKVKGLDDFDEWLAIKHPVMEEALFERFTNERNRVADKLFAGAK